MSDVDQMFASVVDPWWEKNRIAASPDFGSLREGIAPYSALCRHAAWYDLGRWFISGKDGAEPRELLGLQCLVEALSASPTNNSAAWTAFNDSPQAELSSLRERLSRLPRRPEPGDTTANRALVEDLKRVLGEPGAARYASVAAGTAEQVGRGRPSMERAMERHFDNWDYQTVQELERLVRTLPILSREKASEFFKQAKKVAGGDGDPVERQSGKVFDSLMGFVSASDRKDFTVTCQLETQAVASGVLMLETYDSVMGILFCVARISENMFLTRGYTNKDKESVKSLGDTTASAVISGDIRNVKHKNSNIITTQLGHFTHVSDREDLPRPGVLKEWKKNYQVHFIALARPEVGKWVASVNCGVCGAEVSVEVASKGYVFRIRILCALVTACLSAFIYMVYSGIEPGVITWSEA